MWRSIAAYGAVTTLNRAVVFLSTLLLTRAYSPAEIGTYVLVYTFAQLVLPLASLGGGTVVLRESAEDRAAGHSALQVYVAFMVAVAGAALACAFIFPRIPEWLRFGLLIGTLDAMQQVVTSYFQGRERVGAAVLLTGAKTVLFLSVIGWAVLGGWPLDQMLWWQVGQGVLVGLLPAVMIAGAGTFRNIRSLVARHSAALSYGALGIPHTFALWAISSSDRLLLGTFGSKAALGAYVLSFTVAQCVMLPHSGYAAVFSVNVARAEEPWLAKGRIERLILQAGAASVLVLAVACGAALVDKLYIGFVQWGDGPIFLRAGTIAAGMVLSLGYLTFASFTLRRRMTGTISRMTITAAAMSTPLVLLAVLSFGADGAAFSALVGYGIMAVLYFRQAARLIPELADRRMRLLGLALLVCGLHAGVGVAFHFAAESLGI